MTLPSWHGMLQSISSRFPIIARLPYTLSRLCSYSRCFIALKIFSCLSVYRFDFGIIMFSLFSQLSNDLFDTLQIPTLLQVFISWHHSSVSFLYTLQSSVAHTPKLVYPFTIDVCTRTYGLTKSSATFSTWKQTGQLIWASYGSISIDTVEHHATCLFVYVHIHVHWLERNCWWSFIYCFMQVCKYATEYRRVCVCVFVRV